MPKRPRRPRDPNELAFQVFQESVGEAPRFTPRPETEGRANQRAGGVKGAQARAKKLTPMQRSEIARLAAEARWKKADR